MWMCVCSACVRCWACSPAGWGIRRDTQPEPPMEPPTSPHALRQGPITPHRTKWALRPSLLTPSPSHLLCRQAAASRLFTPPVHTSAFPHLFPPAPQSCPPNAGSPQTAQSRNAALPVSRTAVYRLPPAALPPFCTRSRPAGARSAASFAVALIEHPRVAPPVDNELVSVHVARRRRPAAGDCDRPRLRFPANLSGFSRR